MPRYFSLHEAESLIPEVEKAIRHAIRVKADYIQVETELGKFSERIQMMGGSRINRDDIIALRDRRETLASLLREAIENIQSFGCQVKDLDIGLIDFPTLYKGEEVLLCWKLGERGITWWHGLEEGFRGRKPIDDEFIAGHRGDKTN
jgi:hypothetical protein